MALTGRGDSTRMAEGLIPLVATTVRRRFLVGEGAVANWLGVSRNVGIVHVLLASTVPVANARKRGSPTMRSSVEREFVRFIAIECDTRPEKRPCASKRRVGCMLTAGLESPGSRCT